MDVAGNDAVVADADVQPGDAVEDHAHRVEAPYAPRLHRQRLGEQHVLAMVPRGDVLPQRGLLGDGRGVRQHLVGEMSECRVVAEDMADRLVEIGQKRLEVAQRRAAVDSDRRAVDFDLAGMAGGGTVIPSRVTPPRSAATKPIGSSVTTLIGR